MDIVKENLLCDFNKFYSPNINDSEIKRILDMVESNSVNESQLCSCIVEVIKNRASIPFIGSKIAGEEIYNILIKILMTPKGVHIETLLAVIGSLGGHECIKGIMTALRLIVSGDFLDRSKEKAVAGLLDIIIIETDSNDYFVAGDRIGNTFLSFYYTAAEDNNVDISGLIDLSAKVLTRIGTDDYWKTSFDEYILKSPKELLELFDGKFEQSLNLYCFSPQERMIAFAVAAQKAVQQAEKIMDKQRALDIIADFGWRMAHCLKQGGFYVV